jgi:hypothetical protein
MNIGVGFFPAKTLITLLRLHSLALSFGTFASAKGQASSPHDGLLRESPIQMFYGDISGIIKLFYCT